jgi:hypothetical protein
LTRRTRHLARQPEPRPSRSRYSGHRTLSDRQRREAGEAIPLKFSLHGNRGSDVLSANATTWTPCSSSAGTTVAGSLSYNASLDRYTFLATTDKAWAGPCADLTLALRNGTAHQARFTFGK